MRLHAREIDGRGDEKSRPALLSGLRTRGLADYLNANTMLYRGALFPSRLFYNSICDPGAPPTRRAAREATGALAQSFVHCNIVKSPSFHHDYLPASPPDPIPLFPSTSGIFPRAFFRLYFSISRWKTRSHGLLSPSSHFLSVIVRVFRILRIIYKRFPLPAPAEARRRCKSGPRGRNFAFG